jgi:hypothetical protein
MYSEPQDGAVRRSRRWALVAALLVAGVLGTGEAWADIKVHVMNCASSGNVKADAYDANDGTMMVAASSAKFAPGESASLYCAGEGEGYCRLVIETTSTPEACGSASGGFARFHLDSGKWAVVTGFETVKSDSSTVCNPVVEQNLDSAPTSCN